MKRAIDVEAGVSEVPRVTEEHPDGCKYNNMIYMYISSFKPYNFRFVHFLYNTMILRYYKWIIMDIKNGTPYTGCPEFPRCPLIACSLGPDE